MSIENVNESSSNIRWRRRKEARPPEILRAALACFAERGFAATKLDDVAARAGVTKGTLYLYFPNKEEIFKAVVRTELIPLIDKVEKKIAAKNLSAGETLKLLVTFWTQRMINSRFAPLPKLIISEGANFPELARFYVEEVVARAFVLIGGILRRGIETGEFRTDLEVENTIYCIVSPVLFSMLYKHSLEPHTSRKLSTESLFETHINLILRGLAKD